MEQKDRIIKEASRLFFSHGIRGMTMSDIANHLGVSKRTLYEVFKDKEELLEACLDKNMAEADIEIEELVNQSQNVIDTMMRLYAKHIKDMHNANKSTIYDFRKYHPQLYKKIERKQKEGISTFLPLFENGVKQGLVRDDINFEVMLWLLKAQFKMLIEEEFIPTDKYSIEEFSKAIILNFTRGIATPQGNELIDEMVKKLNKKVT